MEMMNRKWGYSLVIVLAGLLATGARADTVVDLEFISGGGTADLVPARSLNVDTINEATYAWSDSAYLFDGVASRNQKVYGAYTTTGAGIVGGADLEVQDSGPADGNDFLRFDAVKTASGDQASRVLALWDSADFLTSGFNSFDASAGSSLTLGIHTFANSGGGMGARFVIRDGSQFYISSFSMTATASIDGTTAGLQWGAFDVNNWASFDNSDANVGMGVTFSDQTFDNVTGVGFMSEIARPNTVGPVFRVDDFQAALVPEPMTLGLISIAGASLLFLRRLQF